MKDVPTRLYLGESAVHTLEYKVNEVVNSANKYTKISLSIDN